MPAISTRAALTPAVRLAAAAAAPGQAGGTDRHEPL